MADDFTALLDSYAASTLHEMAEANNIANTDADGKRLTKNRLVARLNQEFFTEARILAAYQQLSDVERAVLERLLLRDGKIPTYRLKREVVRAKLATEAPPVQKPKYSYGYSSEVPYAEGYVGRPDRANSDIFEDIIARLTSRGLVFSRDPALNAGGVPYKLRFHPSGELYIPDVIRKVLPEPEPLPPALNDWQPANILKNDPTILLRDLYLYWDFVRANDVAMLTTGLVGKRSLKAINDILLVADPLLDNARREDQTGRLYLLRLLLDRLGLVEVRQQKLQITEQNGLAVPDFWQKPQAKQISACLNRWLSLDEFTDYHSEALKNYGANITSARRAIVYYLKKEASDQWTELDTMLEDIQLSNPNFLIPERQRVESSRSSSYYYSRYSSNYFYGKPSTLLAAFDQLESAYVAACVSGVLYQLGLVELGSDQPDPPAGAEPTWTALRLSAMGQTVLKDKAPDKDAAKHSGKLVIQPNFQLLAMGPVGLDVLSQLDLFAEREQADRGAFQYKLTRESVYQAQQRGMSVADIVDFLKQQVGQEELPQNVRRSLEEWASHHERIVFRQDISLLQAVDPELLERLLADPATGPLLARPVAGDVALIENGQKNSLIEQLTAQKILPAVSGADPQAADQSVVVQADGAITPVHAVPSLHLRGRLAAIAEEADGGQWQLTPASVRRAGGSRNKVVQTIVELKRLHRGTLPEAIEVKVKAWGGYYGNATTETLTLMEFRDQQTMAELLAHPELKDKLEPLSVANRALVVVAPDQLDPVKAVLSELGVAVNEGLRR